MQAVLFLFKTEPAAVTESWCLTPHFRHNYFLVPNRKVEAYGVIVFSYFFQHNIIQGFSKTSSGVSSVLL